MSQTADQLKPTTQLFPVFSQIAALENISDAEVIGFIKSSTAECPSYKFIAVITSDDPFNPVALLNAIKNNVVNPFTNTPITNLGQACDHAAMQCEQLRKNDVIEKNNLRKFKNAQRQKNLRNEAKQALAGMHPQIPEWEAAIKEAIAKRNELNALVASLRAKIAFVTANHIKGDANV